MIDPSMISADEVVWLVLSVVGIALNAASLLRYRRQRPRTEDEARVRRMGLVGASVHLGIKIGFLLGAVLAMTQPWPELSGRELGLLYGWRGAIICILVALDFETFYIRINRDALAQSRRLGADEQAQQDRMEATGEESVERLRRGHIGDRESRP